jgi:predicted enzyme related to lactoylglutathione lyase
VDILPAREEPVRAARRGGRIVLSDKRVACALPCKDLERAKLFYKEKLELSPSQEDPGGIYYEVGEGTGFFLYESTGASRGEFTQMGFEVDDVEAIVAELRERGVEFEQYDFPGLKTDENGIADIEGERGAWFKDSEGNLLSVGERQS